MVKRGLVRSMAVLGTGALVLTGTLPEAPPGDSPSWWDSFDP